MSVMLEKIHEKDPNHTLSLYFITWRLILDDSTQVTKSSMALEWRERKRECEQVSAVETRPFSKKIGCLFRVCSVSFVRLALALTA